MKTMTCNQLGGACDKEFHAESFEEMAKLSKQHGIQMAEQNDQPHLDAMEKMRELMGNPEDMEKWFKEKQMLFESLKENKV